MITRDFTILLLDTRHCIISLHTVKVTTPVSTPFTSRVRRSRPRSWVVRRR
jgi:hypothetical protein